MSSLGYQTLYRLLNGLPGVCCERATLESWRDREPLRSLESGRAVGDASVVALSVATEAEVAGAARALIQAGIPPLEKERRKQRGSWPLVVAGGPLTYADGRPLAALADVVLGGEAEDGLARLMELLLQEQDFDIPSVLGEILSWPGVCVPLTGDDSAPDYAAADQRWLPACSAITTPHCEFGDMFLVELARGCPRRCSFCVMEPRKFRTVPAEKVLAVVPDHARRVGLVGAALGDHPQLTAVVEQLVAEGRRVSLSSLRADRLTPDLVRLLVKGGAKSLTVATDGASERLRRLVRKRVTAESLLGATQLARDGGLRAAKLYAMVGLPSEEDEDLLELAELAGAMAHILPVSLAVSPFVPKAGTSLAEAPFVSPAVHRRRLALLRERLRGRAEVRAASVRAAWIENLVARAGVVAGVVAVDVARGGGSYQAWKKAALDYDLIGGSIPPPP
jgi:radical SAM superfamily enzyme YgiQ (UPF0313 family)